jgi:hypothetical protein
VIVAVAAMRMVEGPAHEIVRVVAVRHGLVPASAAMLVRGVVPAAPVRRSTARGVRAPYRDHALVHVVAVHAVQVTIV